MTRTVAGFRPSSKNTLAAAMSVERMRDQVNDLTHRYIKLRAAVRDYLGCTPDMREACERRLRQEIGQWSE